MQKVLIGIGEVFTSMVISMVDTTLLLGIAYLIVKIVK